MLSAIEALRVLPASAFADASAGLLAPSLQTAGSEAKGESSITETSVGVGGKMAGKSGEASTKPAKDEMVQQPRGGAGGGSGGSVGKLPLAAKPLELMSMKELRTRAFELGLTEADLDEALDEATEQNTKPKDMVMRAVLGAEKRKATADGRWQADGLGMGEAEMGSTQDSPQRGSAERDAAGLAVSAAENAAAAAAEMESALKKLDRDSQRLSDLGRDIKAAKEKSQQTLAAQQGGSNGKQLGIPAA